jgi:hypothetical protein
MKKNQVLIFKKGAGEKFSVNLTQDEIDCKCKSNLCHYTLFRQSTIDAFEGTRYEFGSAIICVSGYRCQYHNKKPLVGGVYTSNHTMGDAMDLVPLNGDLDGLEIIARKHFKLVLRYKTFLHCDGRLFKTTQA